MRTGACMSAPIEVRRGAGELRRLLDTCTEDVRSLDAAGFRDWLARRSERWQRDPVFLQRSRNRDLRRVHPRLRDLEAEERRARAADEAAPSFQRLSAVERELADTGKAIAGLAGALVQADGEERVRLGAKLQAFRTREAALREEHAALLDASGPRRELFRIRAELDRVRRETGVEAAEARLRELLTERGRRSGRSGGTFEDAAVAAVRDHVMPELLCGAAEGRVLILRGVTLGAARTEIDQLVVRTAADPDGPVEVLALVEAKRNLNDLGHGFRKRQENLGWLTGSGEGYDPERYRTRTFPMGHFDRPAIHTQEGESFRLAPGSFHRFVRDPGCGMFLDRLYLVTRPGTMWGLSAAALSRIAHRAATDEQWDRRSEAYVLRLQRWCRSLADPVESPDVLRLYAADEERARQVLLLALRGT